MQRVTAWGSVATFQVSSFTPAMNKGQRPSLRLITAMGKVHRPPGKDHPGPETTGTTNLVVDFGLVHKLILNAKVAIIPFIGTGGDQCQPQ